MGRLLNDPGTTSLAITGLSLGEGRTPLELDPGLARWAGISQLWVKREDSNPTGSHKDRGAVVQVAYCVQEGRPVAVISSSGNAALSAATYGSSAGVVVVGLLSPIPDPAPAAATRPPRGAAEA